MPTWNSGADSNADRSGHAPRRFHRPWGWFETLAEGPDYLVKRLYLNPGRRISLQIIEVQRGGWLSEDDIERFEDDFGRLAPAA
jgi:mannose-6-phosphate isomerase-like protein (cupin superfamily)